MIRKEDVKPVRILYRVLAGFIFVLGCFTTVMSIYFMFIETFSYMFIVLLSILLLMTFISGKVMLTGYAPSFLLFTHAPNEIT